MRQKIMLVFCGFLLWVNLGQTTEIVHTIGSDGNKITVIYLKGTPYEMGYLHGHHLKEQVQQFYDNVLKAWARHGAVPLVLDLAFQKMAPFIAAEYQEEMRGLAAGAEVPIEIVQRAHALPDVAEFNCTFFAAWGKATPDQQLYQIRALDFSTDTHIQEFPAIFVYEPENGHRFINIGWIGLTGVISGMSARQLAVSEIGENFGSTHETLAGEPMPYVLRDVLQHCQTLEEAVVKIQHASRTSSFLYCVGDGKIPAANSFKTAFDFCEVFTPQTAPHANLLDDVVFFSMGVSGSWNQKIFNYLNPRYGRIDAETGKNLMHDLGTGNLHAVVYAPAQGKIWVANAAPDQTPAYNREFVAFDLSQADEIFANYPTSVNPAPPTREDFRLLRNFPNPFNATTRIHYSLAEPGFVHLAIFNTSGQKIASLIEESQSAGNYQVEWNGVAPGGASLPTGVYFIRLNAGGRQQLTKTLLLK
jgi:hypothetical protein